MGQWARFRAQKYESKIKNSNVLSTKRKRCLIQRNGNEAIIIIIDTYSVHETAQNILWLVTIIKIMNFFLCVNIQFECDYELRVKE